MPKETAHMIYEVDIGSGEKGPAEQETQREIEQIHSPDAKPDDRIARHPPEDKPANGKPS